MLVHHADPVADRLFGGGDLHLLSLDVDAPCIGLGQAVQDIHQCALSCPVFPQQAVDLACLYCKIDLMIGAKA